MPQLKKRSEVAKENTWDLTDLVASEESFNEQLSQLVQDAKTFESIYKRNLSEVSTVIAALSAYEKLFFPLITLGTYARLSMETDRSDSTGQMRNAKMNQASDQVYAAMAFFKDELLLLSDATLGKIQAEAPAYRNFLDDILRDKPYQLHPEVEKTLAILGGTLDAPYLLYNTMKSVDMNFPNFEVQGESFPLSYSSFENEWEHEVDPEKRRAAFTAFSNKLRDYQFTTAKVYDTHIQTEKKMSDLRGYPSVIDSLLHRQYVDRTLYHRQIDLITKELAPHMRRYAKLLQKVNGLDRMTFADLKISLDPDFDPVVTKEDGIDYVMKSLAPMGEDYTKMLETAFANRWIDYEPNLGKSTGAFCSSPYGTHPYVLMSWNDKMSDVFTLAHELGHAGHFYNAHKYQNVFNGRASMYFIEAPSTMNEMLLANHLMKSSDDLRFQRWVISNIVSKTYYHNFVTHLLEAAYQREVYKIIDGGGSVTAPILNDLKRTVLEDFWGDTVDITEGAELTWMRQPHYYMGLYPYTYSAGLTISTQVSQRILHGEEGLIEDWLKVLQAGGTRTPEQLAQMAGVDVSTEEPLRNTIAYIGELITQLEELTEELGE